MFFSIKRTLKYKKGFGLIETIISVSIFLLVAVSIYGGFTQILKVLSVLKTKTLAANIANEQIEIVRNLPYVQVGIIDGIPSGSIPRVQKIIRDGISFDVTASIQDIDDPFDGQIGGNPNDTSPADYKIIEFILKCENCNYPEEIKYVTRVSPQSLETEGNNGALFVRVFDANGNAISGANINILNNQGSSTIDIDETTNLSGLFQIVNAPTGTNAYKITVTKDGYSTDSTHSISEVLNPNKPDATVISGQITQLSFFIDKLSNLSVNTKNDICAPVSNVDFRIFGSKTIGEGVLKYDKNKTTDASGIRDIVGLEWDNYLFEILDNSFDLAGSSNLFPLVLNPNNEQNIDLILKPANPNSLLVQVTDGQTGLPLSDAYVKIKSSTNNTSTLVTGKGFVYQTDWSLGDGQDNFVDAKKYFIQDGGIENSEVGGIIRLRKLGDNYVSQGELISSTFDFGVESNLTSFSWENVDQPYGTSIRMQIATNEILTATTTWNFVGPDGTSNTYYSNSGQSISNAHQGIRYLRYKIFMNSNDSSVTPELSNIAFTYTTGCNPLGQVLFQGLSGGNYSLDITRDGYSTYSVENIQINNSWQMYNAVMTP